MLQSIATLALFCLTFTSAFPFPSLFSRAPTCYSGYYIIVGRGTDEPAGTGRAGLVANMTAAAVPGSVIVAVDYPAVYAPYASSVSAGINDTIAKIKAYVDGCKATSKPKVVLVGFSQGGQVMTDTLAGGAGEPGPIDSAYLPYIKATTVFGDPTFSPGQSYSAGNATTAGIYARDRSSADTSGATLNAKFGNTLRSYCSINDIVCASGSSTDVHTAEVHDWATQATNFLVSKKST